MLKGGFMLSVLMAAGGFFNVFTNTGHKPQIEQFDDPALAAIGRLTSARQSCTATLVAPDIILTAAHCFLEPVPPEQYVFELRTTSDERVNVTKIDVRQSPRLYGTKDFAGRPENDYAFAKLARPVHDVIPASLSSLRSAGALERDIHIRLTGTNPAFRGAFTTEICEPTKYYPDGSEFTHNCSTERGMSGSPLYTVDSGIVRIIGLHTGAIHGLSAPAPYTLQFANHAIEGSKLRVALDLFVSGAATLCEMSTTFRIIPQ